MVGREHEIYIGLVTEAEASELLDCKDSSLSSSDDVLMDVKLVEPARGGAGGVEPRTGSEPPPALPNSSTAGVGSGGVDAQAPAEIPPAHKEEA